MKISVNTGNCDANNWYLIEESANSEVELKIEIDKIVTTQSRHKIKGELHTAIQNELSRFIWIVAGSVNVELLWYLNGVERQETDKVGDIDNITKPILDALVGPKGILLDDSQIGSLYTFWQSRNVNTLFNVLYLRISINNDTCLPKKDLYFIQYAGPVCSPININFNDLQSILNAVITLRGRKNKRIAAKKIKMLGANVDDYLVTSDWEFHRTRLNGFDSQVLSEEQFKKKCCESGFTWNLLRELLKRKNKENA